MKNTKKLVGAIAALAVSAALATGTTYAWFSQNGTATVESFQIDVGAEGDNLDIAAVPTSDTETQLGSIAYSKNISATQLWSAIVNKTWTGVTASDTVDTYTAKSSIKLEPLTTASHVLSAGSNLSAKTYTNTNESGATEGTAATSSSFALYTNSSNVAKAALDKAAAPTHIESTTSTSKAEGTYISFDIVFRTPVNTALSILLTQNSKVTAGSTDNSSSVVAWETIAANTYGNDDEIAENENLSARGANAVRFAFGDMGAQTSTLSSETSVAYTYWAPNEAYTNGEAKGDVDSTSAVANENYAGYYKGNLAGAYNKNKGIYTNYVNKQVALPTGYSLELADPYATAEPSTISKVASIVAKSDATDYQYQRMTVTMWIEGTDGDCFDDIIKDSIEATLSFKAVTPKNT